MPIEQPTVQDLQADKAKWEEMVDQLRRGERPANLPPLLGIDEALEFALLRIQVINDDLAVAGASA